MDDVAVLKEEVGFLNGRDDVGLKFLHDTLQALVIVGGGLVDGLLLAADGSGATSAGGLRKNTHIKQVVSCHQSGWGRGGGRERHIHGGTHATVPNEQHTARPTARASRQQHIRTAGKYGNTYAAEACSELCLGGSRLFSGSSSHFERHR